MKEQQKNPNANDALDLSQKTHRRLIGYLGLLLPVLLYILAGLRPTGRFPAWQLMHSLSAYYYTGAVAVFVGILFALALFLFSYRGYCKDIADRVLGKIGGFAALGVAICPTKAPNGAFVPSWWHPILGTLHYAFAILLFVIFILFSFWLFRKSHYKNRKERPNDKKQRDRIYLACSVVMAIAIVWAGISLSTGAPIFWQEAIAIEGFAISWLVKGEAHQSAIYAIRKLSARSGG